jgi:SAM-dependent methyltransferase
MTETRQSDNGRVAPSLTYVDGSYLARTGGTWHLEDSPFKVGQVLRMLRRHPELQPRSVCDIGCGAGATIAALDRELESPATLVGYDVSPQAHQLSRRFHAGRCRFALGDAFSDGFVYDLALVLDVVEHVEDCFDFLRRCGSKASWKMYHIPLDANASAIIRGANCWDSVGHLHLYTIETALKAVAYSGQTVIDSFLTPAALVRPNRPATQIANIARRVLPDKLAARLLGGYSVMILAR